MQPNLPSVLNETMDLVFNVCIMMYMYIIITLSLNKVMMKQHMQYCPMADYDYVHNLYGKVFGGTPNIMMFWLFLENGSI